MGPFAFGGGFPPAAPAVRMSACEVPFVDCVLVDAPSISLAIAGSEARSSFLGFFRRAKADACAEACLAASAAGSSFTSAYSLCILEATSAFCARSRGEGLRIAAGGWEEF